MNLYQTSNQTQMKQFTFVKPMLIACAFLLFISQASFAQKTWDRGANTDNWGDANNWSSNILPTSSESVTIVGNQTVVVNINTAVCAALNLAPTASGTASLSFNANSKLIASGTVTLGQSGNNNRRGSLVMTNGGTLVCNGFALANTGTNIFTRGTGSVVLTATNTLPSSTFTTFNNLKDSIGTTTLSTNLSVTGSLSVSKGATLALSTFTLGSPTSLDLECGSVTGSRITGSGVLTLGGNITVTDATTGTDGASIACPVELGATRSFTVADDGTTASDLTMTGIISGTGFGTTKAGSGELHLSGVNTYTGLTTISAGILKMGNNAALGTSAGATTVSSGGTLELNGFTTSDELTLNGTGTGDIGALANNGSFVSHSTKITLGSSASIITNGSGGLFLNYATPITGSFDLILGGTSTSDNGISTVLSMSTLTKNGVGNWKLSATNTYTGLTTINAGTLKLDSDNTTTLGTAAGGTIVNTGAVLDLNGKTLGVAEPLTLNGTGISNGGALINSSGTAASYSGAISLASASGIGTTGNITLSSTVLGGFDLTKYGAGTLNMGAATDSLGSLTMSAGTYKATSGTTKLRGNFTNNATFTHNSGTVLFMGTSAQTLSGTTAATSFQNITLNNSTGITLSTVDPSIANTLTLTSGNITTGSDSVIIAAAGSITRTSGHIVGNLKKFISTSTTSKLFEIGDASNYTPVTITNIAATGATGSYNVSSTSGDHPNISTSGLSSSKSVNRFFTITKPNAIPGATTFGATLNFVSGDIDAGANANNFLVKYYDGSSWQSATVGTKTSTSIQITSQTNTGAFQIGETAGIPVVSSQPTVQNICAGDDATFSANASDVVSTKWQRFNGTTWSDISANLDAGTLYSGFTTTTLTLTGSTTALNSYQYRAVFTNPGGSVNSNDATLTVNASPTVSISGPTSACGSITLTATGGISYVWDGGSSTETASNTFTSSGTYTVTADGENGCINTASQTITVLAVPTAVNATASSNTICGTGTVNLNGTASGVSSSTIAFQGFESSGSTVTYAASGGSTKSGTSASGDRPALTSFVNSGTGSYWVNSGTATITTANITGLAGYSAKKVSMKLATFIIGSTTAGNESSDIVTVAISLNGGSTYSNELSVNGGNFGDSHWSFTSGTGLATVAYDGLNTATAFAPSGSGARTTDGYSNLHITIPDTATQVRIRVTMLNSSVNEAWVIDDITLTGTQMAYSWTSNPAGFTSNFENPQNVSVAQTTTYTLTATNAAGCSATDTAIVRVKTNVGITSATAASSSICASATTTLTANGLTGTNAVVTWWSLTGGSGTNYGTGTTLTNRGPGTYYARVTGDCGTAEASVTVSSLEIAGITSATAASSALCTGSTTTLTANDVTGLNAVLTWYTGAGGTGTNLGTGTTITRGPGTYYARVTADCGSAVEASVTVATLAAPTEVTATASVNTLCGTGTVNLTGTASGAATDTIKLLNFEGTGTTLNYVASNTSGTVGTVTGNSTSSDRPQSSPFFTTSNTGYRVRDGRATLTTDNITGLEDYTAKKVSMRLAAFSIGSSSNGLDNTDSVGVAISLNGGTTYSNELTIDGNNNAYWAYSATGVATVTYDGNNNPNTFAPSSGGSRTSDGYSNLHITIPDTASQVRIRVTMGNSSGSEAWVVDDISLTGIQMAYSWTSDPASFTSNLKNPTNVSVSDTTIFTLTVTNGDGCSATDTAIVRVSQGSAIASVTATSSSICASATTTLTANGVVGTNAVVTWYTGAGGTGTNLGTGTTIERGPGTYYARVTGDCGTAVEASVTVSSLANAGITSATAASGSICATATTTLTANGAVGINAVVTWYTGAGGTGTNLGTGTTLSNQGPGTYYARVTADCGSAVEAIVTVTTKVNVAITSATAASSTICSSATTTLTANGVLGTNAVVTWWTGAGGTGTNLGTGTTISRAPGTYYARVTGDCGTAVEASVTVTAKVNVGITSATAATSSICSSATTTLTANGVVGTNAVVTWWSGTGGTGTNYGTGTTIDRGPGTYYARVTGDCGTAVQASVTVSALTNAGITSATAASASICASATTTLTANGVTGLSPVVTWWTGAGGTGTNLGTGTTLTNQGPGTYYARVTANCGTAEASVIVATKASPTLVEATPATSDICEGASQILNASATISSTAIDTVDFNEFVSTSYTTAGSASNGGNKFAIQNSPYNPNSNTYIITNNVNGSSDGTSFMITTAANLNGSTTTTSQLISTVYNTQGYTDLKLVFNHSYVRNSGSGTSTVEVSSDGGTNWTVVKSYSSNQGANNNFVKDSIVLNSYINQSNLKIRFNANISASFAVSWWAIDKVLLKGNFPMTPLFSWSANTATGVNGLTTNAQTYSAANSTTTVSPTDTTLYTLTAKDPLTGCTTSATPITVNVLSNPSAPIATGASRCSTGRVLLMATVGVDETVDWYTGSSEVTAIATGTDVWQTPVISETTTYYIATRNTTTGCVSATRTPVVATINNITESNSIISNCISYFWNGTTYTNSGTYSYSTTNAAGCDSTATLNLTITLPSESDTSITNCDSYVWNGTTYSNSGTYSYTTTNAAGCDSIAILNLTIKQSSTITDNITNCNTYTWNGTTYSNSGTYSFSTTNAVGCDSTTILNLTINNSTVSSPINITVCDGFTWNDDTYTESGVYSYSTTNSVGCDSTATLNLTVKKSTTSTTVVEECDAYRWNNATYSASGIFTYTTTNSVGCDSVASLELTIKYSTSFEFSESNCDNYLWNGVTYSASGTYSFTTTNAVGCDSVTTLNLTILESSTSATTESACEQYQWNGVTYSNSGTYLYRSTNSSGCSSTDTLYLTIKRGTTSSTDEISCETFAWNGSVYSNTGTFTYNTTNSVGCDSLALLNLTILNGTNETIYAESCVNYFINDSLYTESGTYTQRLVNSVGCDSILNIILTINQGTFTSNTVSNCDSYMWNNILYTRSGQFIVYYNNASGCLSADTLYLTIRNSSTSTTNISVCNSYNWNGEEYTTSGVYTYITTNAANCDSTATLNLTIETAPDLDPITGLTDVCMYTTTTYSSNVSGGRWSSDDTTKLRIDSITGIATSIESGVANITYLITTSLGCTNSVSLEVTVLASELITISGLDNVCNGSTITLSSNEDDGVWSVDNNSIATIGTSSGIVEGVTAGNALITYTYTESSSGCVSTDTFTVTVNELPSAPDSIVGLQELCQYVNLSDTIEYSVPLVSGITTYNWTVPVGATIVSGQNTSTIRVLFTDQLPRSGARIYVNSVSDAGCVSGTTSLRIYKSMPYLFTLTGPNNACPLVGTETIVYYTTNISATANYYDWVVPSGATIVSGQGTYQIGVTYDTSFRSGYIRVRGLSNCGVMSGTGKYLAITRSLPTAPGFISGPSNTCAYYNNGTEVTYSVSDVNFASSYLWTLPNNVTLVSGQGTNTIVVRFESGFVNSTLKVRAISNCSSTLDRGINLTANAFAVPTYVNGPTNACMYVNTGNMATYVCSKSTGAPSYIWTVPAGVTITERPGDLPENDTIIRVTFDENFVTASKIEVQTSGCNTSLARTLTINKNIPFMPGSINGANNVCNYVGNSSTVRYSVRRVLHASQYLWTVPNNAQIQSYDGDTAINVLFNAGFTNGSIDVRTSNACGMSSSRAFGVSRIAPATPEDIEGPTNSCAYYGNGATATYTIPAVQGANGYVWSLPPYVTLVSGQNTTSITVRFDSGYATSNIKVKSLNACTESLDKTLRVIASPYGTPGTISGPTNSCIYLNDGIATYKIRKVVNATGYLWTVPTGATIIDHPAGSGPSDTIIKVTYTPDFVFGTSIRVQSMGCGLSNPKTLAITGSISTQPGNITGTSNVCEFVVSQTNPNGIIATYRIRKVSSANAYAWTVPENAEIVGHPGGTGINDTAIQVKFGDEFIDGSIKVRSSNSCGSSSERSFSVSRTQPSKPGPISTTTLSACPNRMYRYSISSMPSNATSVVWTVPTVASIVSQTSLSITVSYPSAAITGTVKAQSFNNCSSSDFRTLNVRYNACPNSIIGTTPVVTGRVEAVEITKPLSLGVSVYPNPTTSSFKVKVKAVSAEKLHIKLMDMAGRYLKLYQIMPGEDLNFGNELRAGVYMIEVTQGNLKSVERLMKF